ncbi:MAG TPA: 6-pyruvoyl tetrahydrobiopterin synthase [Candidatus Omnitrophica bacterium]|nr:6-pyruvoyl tetrahydrobiopterin synthase [Candidatus Omnitrophota bacterium]
MYTVIREIHFSYGHRLVGHQGKCRHVHGHNGRVQIEVAASTLDQLGMVIDFSEISRTIGKWIDENFDHVLILWEKDPLASVLKERGEKILVVAENPTAEYLARRIFEEARKMELPVARVVVWETNDSCASYQG